MNIVKMSWDLDHPIKKGERFKFNWPGMGICTEGYAIATENFKKMNLSKKEAKELDTNPGIHYYGSAIAHYK